MSQIPTGLILNLLLPVRKSTLGSFMLWRTQRTSSGVHAVSHTVSPEEHQDSYNSLKASPVQRLSHRDSEDTH